MATIFRYHRCFGIGWMVFLLPALLSAQTGKVHLPIDTTIVLPDITITATRTRIALAEAPARVTVLNAQTIQASGASHIAGLLASRSSLFIRRYGKAGLATMTLRGSSSSQTLILLDGQRLNDPQLGQLDLTLLPAFLLESVEILHGAGSALYGSDGIGGVINLHTIPPDVSRFHFSAGTGAFGERKGNLSGTGQHGHWAGLAAFNYEQGKGDFQYVNRTLFPPRTVRRNNADFLRRSLYVSLKHHNSRHQTRWGGWWTDAERGLPGPATQTTKEERQWDHQLRFWSNHETRLGWGALHLGGLLQKGRLRYLNPQLGLDDTGNTWAGSLDVELRAAIGRQYLVNGGFSGGFGRAAHPSLTEKAGTQHLGAFMSAIAHYGRLHFYPALRLDVHHLGKETRPAFSPRFGLNVQPLATKNFRLKTSLGRAFRVPTLNDRFWADIGARGNPDLQPETGWTMDAGLFLQHASHQLEVTAYRTRTRDQIVWQPAGSIWMPANLAKVHTTGLELSYKAGLSLSSLQTNGGLIYTLTDATDQSTPASRSFGQPLRYVPRHQIKAFVGAGLRGIQLDVSGQYVGRRFITTDGRQSLDPYLNVDAQLRLSKSFSWGAGILSLFVNNLLNRDYAIINQYPMPPRHVQVQLTFDFINQPKTSN